MSTVRAITYFAAWFVASVMIAVVMAILAVEVARLAGIAESGTSTYRWVLNATFLMVLVSLVAVPFVFRSRFNRFEKPPPGA